VLAKLKGAGGGKATTYAVVADRLKRTPQARADSLALLIAVGVGLIALTHLLAWLAGQLGRRRTEVAGLRAAGIRPRSVRGAYLVEAVVLAVIVLVTAAIAAALTTIPLLKPMGLVGGWPPAPALRLEVRPLTLAAVVLGVAAATAVLCAVVFTRFGRSARPGSLRSADR
jgi:putative ABC transport system permease protein